jgi:hypothetical protein
MQGVEAKVPTKRILSAIKNEDDEIKELPENSSFPVSVMPVKMQQIINDVSITYGFNIDYLSCAILSAASSAIGATYKVKVMGIWEESALLFMVLVGRPGVNKSAPITWAYKPISNKDADDFKHYQNLLEKHKADEKAKNLERFKKYNQPNTTKNAKNAKNAENAENAENANDEKPRWKQRIVSDATVEALCSVLFFNKRGISLVMDEIVALFKNFNRYNKGSDQEFWLQEWSNISISINRKNDEPIFINNPFISFIGAIQPAITDILLNDGRQDNGYIDRIIFVYPDIKMRPVFKFSEPDDSAFKDYNNIINRLLELDFNDPKLKESNILPVSHDAQKMYEEWTVIQREILEANNNDRLYGLYAKMEIYVFRFALIYQLLSWACGEEEKFEVEEIAMHSAIETAEYFKRMALKVNPIKSGIKQPPMDKQRQEIYKALSKEFTTGEGAIISLKYGLNDRRFKEWLHDITLFTKLKHGIYEKVL